MLIVGLCCRQLGISLHTLDSALPLYDALTGQRIGEELDRYGSFLLTVFYASPSKHTILKDASLNPSKAQDPTGWSSHGID